MAARRYADIYVRDAQTCQFCGNRAVTTDHLIPVIAGGSNEMLNLVGACARCNRVKADMRLPNLVNAFQRLLEAGRTRKRGYPILLWQALLLGYPLEDIPWSQTRSRWCRKVVADVLFNQPDKPIVSISKTDAKGVVERIRPYDLLTANRLLASLVKESYILDSDSEYRRGTKAPPPKHPQGLLPPSSLKREESGFGMVGEPREWVSAKALKGEIDEKLSQLGPSSSEAKKQVWDILLQKRWVFDCDPFFLVDRRKPLKRYVVAAWRQLGKSR